jgi:hypothetical protein
MVLSSVSFDSEITAGEHATVTGVLLQTIRLKHFDFTPRGSDLSAGENGCR